MHSKNKVGGVPGGHKGVVMVERVKKGTKRKRGKSKRNTICGETTRRGGSAQKKTQQKGRGEEEGPGPELVTNKGPKKKRIEGWGPSIDSRRETGL